MYLGPGTGKPDSDSNRRVARCRRGPWLAPAAAIFCVTLAACAPAAQLLNSERISQRFGSFGIAVLASDGHERISNLYSETDGVQTCRTHATVRFTAATDPRVADEHELVLSGQSMGAVFKARGWIIDKRTIHIGTQTLGRADASIAHLMHLESPRSVAKHVYVFAVARQGRSIDYARITELHHPDYLTEADLQSIYGRPLPDLLRH